MPELSPALARGQKGGPKINKSSESENQILALKRAVQARVLPLNYSRSASQQTRSWRLKARMLLSSL